MYNVTIQSKGSDNPTFFQNVNSVALIDSGSHGVVSRLGASEARGERTVLIAGNAVETIVLEKL